MRRHTDLVETTLRRENGDVTIITSSRSSTHGSENFHSLDHGRAEVWMQSLKLIHRLEYA